MGLARKTLAFIVMVVFIFMTIISNVSGSVASALDNTTTLKYDFENGTTTDWVARFGAGTIATSEEAAHGGQKSLKGTDVGSGWKGPLYDLKGIATPGATFTISAWVMQKSGSEQSVVLQTNVNYSTEEKTAIYNQKSIESGVWTEFTGTYTLNSYEGSLTQFEFWIQGQGVLDTYYVDDVTITYTNPSSVGDSQYIQIINSTFETGVDGWQGRGSAVIEASTENAHSPGNMSLKISGRDASWNGAQYDLTGKIDKGNIYNVSAWVYQNSGLDKIINISMQNEKSNIETTYPTVTQAAVPSGIWTELKADYSCDNTYDKSLLYFQAPDTDFTFYVDDISVKKEITPPASIQEDIPSLKDVLNFKIGVAVGGSTIDANVKNGAVRKQLITKHFDSITPENEMKPDFVLDLTATKNGYVSDAISMPQFDFTQGDKVAQFAKDNGMVVRGHTLAWHAQTPDWLFREGYDSTKPYASREIMQKRLEAYITTVINHYEVNFPGVIYAWDVVNEAVDTNGDANGLRTSWEGKAANWYTYLGADFIEKAFIYADAAVDKNPDGSRKVKLFYNDYSTEDPGKRTAIYNLVKGLRDKGIELNNRSLIDGVGLQSHNDMNGPTVTAIEKTIDDMASLGLEVQLTELDLNFHAANQAEEVNEGYRYKEIFDMLKTKPAVTGVTVWGLTDDTSWLRSVGVPDADPLLFDKNFQAKYTYWGIVDPSHLPVFINNMKALKGASVIDGSTDPIWDIQTPKTIGSTPEANFKTAWDDNNLYIFANVTDSTKDDTDAVEVMVDQNNDKAANDSTDSIFTINRDNVVTGASSITSSVNETTNGYNIEIKVPLTDPSIVAKIIGFDIVVHDGNQMSIWNNKNYMGEKVPANYGNITFVNTPKVTEAIKGTPIIDGVIDDKWANASRIDVNNYTQNTIGATAIVKTMWDEDYVYVLADVTDNELGTASPNPWEQDSLEVFFDENNEKTPAYQGDDVQYRVNCNNVKTVSGGLDIDSFVTATAKTDKGYVVEMKIPHKIGAFAENQSIGFDAQINNADATGGRISISNWNDLTGNGWASTANYGILKLLAVPTVVGIKQVSVAIPAGVPPVLPTGVIAEFSNGTSAIVPVVWEQVSAELYKYPGSFKIYGTVDDTTTKAIACITVTNPLITGINVVNITTRKKDAPQMPSTVCAEYSNGTTKNVKVTWNEISPDKYKKEGSFIVYGSVIGTEIKAVANVIVTNKKPEKDF